MTLGATEIETLEMEVMQVEVMQNEELTQMINYHAYTDTNIMPMH